MVHIHDWKTFFEENSSKATYKEGNKHLTYSLIQLCNCGVYRTKVFEHEEDYKNKDGGSMIENNT